MTCDSPALATLFVLPPAAAAAVSIYVFGLVLLFLSMVLDVYLSFLPHLVVLIGALLMYGVSWKAAAAFAIPHVLAFGLLVLKK